MSARKVIVITSRLEERRGAKFTELRPVPEPTPAPFETEAGVVLRLWWFIVGACFGLGLANLLTWGIL